MTQGEIKKLRGEVDAIQRLLTSEGYLTEETKTVMRKIGVRTLEDLLQFQDKGEVPLDQFVSRSDVRVSGHMRETYFGDIFNAEQE